jgi:hypothetical protein
MKVRSFMVEPTGRRVKTVDNCFHEVETTRSKERPKRACERPMRRWESTERREVEQRCAPEEALLLSSAKVRTNGETYSDGNLNKSAPRCEHVVAHSRKKPFCAQALKTSRRAAAFLSSAMTAAIGKAKCGLGNGFCLTPRFHQKQKSARCGAFCLEKDYEKDTKLKADELGQKRMIFYLSGFNFNYSADFIFGKLFKRFKPYIYFSCDA